MIKGSPNFLLDWSSKIPAEFDDYGLKSRYHEPDYFSRFTKAPKSNTTLIGTLCKAVGIIGGKIDRRYIVGISTKGNYLVEIVSASRPEITCLCMYNPDNGNISATAIKTDEARFLAHQMDRSIGAGSSEIHNTDATALMLALLPQVMAEAEGAEAVSALLTRFSSGSSSEADKKEVAKNLSILCDNFYRRTRFMESDLDGQYRIDVNLNSDGNAKKLTEVSAASQKVKEILFCSASYTEFVYFGQRAAEDDTVHIEENEYNLGVELTAKQRACIRELPKGHVSSATEKKILDIIKRTFDDEHGAVKNILLEGPPGTGKSQMAIAISNRLGLPYYPFICSDGTNEDSLLGCYYPVVNKATMENEELLGFLSSLPGKMETLIDPEAAYLKVTGSEKSGATLSDVADAVKEKLSAAIGTGGIQYEYRPSPLVEAFTNGGVVELQEPSAIMSASVLSCLNDIMNSSDGVINTPIGAIKRHPNCFVIATTNPDSNGGYRKLNEAVRNRFQRTYNVQLPTKAEMVERVIKKGYLTDRKMVSNLVDAIMVIDTVISEKGIEGTAGMRCLFEWAKDIAAGDSIEESLMSCVIDNITTIPDEQEWLLDALRTNTSIFS